MIRKTTAADTEQLVLLAQETDVFKPKEIEVLREVLSDYLQKPGGEGYYCHTFEEADDVLGFVCYGPNNMTEGTWDLYWIAVKNDRQAKGVGTELLKSAEQDILRQNGRLLIIETSSLPSYDPTRRFYLKRGYEQTAVIPDFYAPGDSLVFFRKRL